MTRIAAVDFLAGVIEGFYGQPWNQAERLELFDWMAAWNLNTYLYAPKDDLKHRAVWRDLYLSSEEEPLAELIRACTQRHIRFVYALSPGLDIRYGHESDLESLRRRMGQMLALGCRHFALLFDDIPDTTDNVVIQRWGSLASAQCDLTNNMFNWVRERCSDSGFFFCPTAYCGRMAERHLGGEGYLATVGRDLLPEIQVFWTGPEIISREITVAHIQQIQKVLRRKPLIWDNLHANDYDGRRFFCGPYAGRPPELRSMVSGILSNPNNEFPLNYVPLRTLADFVNGEGKWDPRAAYTSAMHQWLPRFATVGQAVALEDLIMFGDCFYLPHAEGPAAEALYEQIKLLLSQNPESWGEHGEVFRQKAVRLRDFCARMTQLCYRPLFYVLSRRVWELREELDLLLNYVEFKLQHGHAGAVFTSDFHLPATYRGGLVAKLRRLLVQHADGSFSAPVTQSVNVNVADRVSQSVGGTVIQREDASAPPLHQSTGSPPLAAPVIRPARPGDESGACYVCLKTGDYGKDGELFYRGDPDALGRIFVGPYLLFERELSLILEDELGICGYALAALDSRSFYARYEAEWRPTLCAQFPAPQGDPNQWTRVEQVHQLYHHPDYFCPDPYDIYPSHLHIDLLARARGHGYGRRMLERLMGELRRRGSPGVHLGVSAVNTPAIGFYRRLGFHELIRTGSGNDRCIYMGRTLLGNQ